MKNKQFFELYVKELVKSAVQEEVKKLLPVLLDEQIGEMAKSVNPKKKINESAPSANAKKPAPDRASIRAIMEKHFSLDGDTLAQTDSPVSQESVMASPTGPLPDFAQQDFSGVMKHILSTEPTQPKLR